MDIEIVEAYDIVKKNKKSFNWSVHVYICAEQFDLRGVFISKRGKSYFVHLPHRWTTDPETNENVCFPTFSYTSPEKNKDLIDSIREKAVPFIKEKIEKEGKLSKKIILEKKISKPKDATKLKQEIPIKKKNTTLAPSTKFSTKNFSK